MKTSFYYVGWFGLCPVLLSDVESECPTVIARWDYLQFWFDFNLWLVQQYIGLMSAFNQDYVPEFPFYISKALENPIIREFDND